MTTYKLLKSMKKKATQIIVISHDTSLIEPLKYTIKELIAKSQDENFFFQSRAIKANSRSYYAVCLPVSKENFEKEFFGNWYYIINELIAIQIKIGTDNILIIKN